MPKPTVLISIQTTGDTTTPTFGRSFVQSLFDEDSRLIPEWLSLTENYKDPFRGIDDFLANWWALPVSVTFDGKAMPDRVEGTSWKRKSNLASRGMVNHGLVDMRNYKHTGNIWFESRWAVDVDFNHLFDVWLRMSKPELAIFHLFTEPELHWQDESADKSFRVGTLGGVANLGHPNIGWAMAFGKGYSHEVDVSRIKEAGFPVEEIGDTIVVRVTASIADVVNNFEFFSRRRAELKSIFRPGMFRIPREPSERDISRNETELR